MVLEWDSKKVNDDIDLGINYCHHHHHPLTIETCGQDIHRDFFPNAKICHHCTQVPGINNIIQGMMMMMMMMMMLMLMGTASQIETAIIIN